MIYLLIQERGRDYKLGKEHRENRFPRVGSLRWGLIPGC